MPPTGGRQERGYASFKRQDTGSVITLREPSEVASSVSGAGGHHLTRQLINKERKVRQGLCTQEAQDYTALLRQAGGAVQIIEAFEHFHAQHTAVAQRRQQVRQQWEEASLAEAMRQLVAVESAERVTLADRYEVMWRTTIRLFHLEGKPLFAERARTLLFEAEEARREFIYREEITAGLLLPLPGYQPLYVGSLRQNATAMGAKVDFMSQQPCPFRFGEHCPYFPKSVLKRNSAAQAMEQTEHTARRQPARCHLAWRDARHTHGASTCAVALRALAAAERERDAVPTSLAGTAAIAASSSLPPPRAAAPARLTSPRGRALHNAGRHGATPLPTHVKLPPVAVDGHVQMSTYAFLAKPHYQQSESCLTKGNRAKMYT